MSFKIRIEGLAEIKKNLKQLEDTSSIEANLAASILKLHTVLDTRVSELYNVPYSLNNVRIGRTVAPERISKTLLRFSLQYRHIAVPLGDYPVSESASSSLSSAPTRLDGTALGYVKWLKGLHSTDYKVAVRKGRATLQGTAGKGAKGSYAFRVGGGYLARRTRQTWHVRPSLGIRGTRTKLQIMYGPSLAALASIVYEKDRAVGRAADKMLDNLAKLY